MAYPRRDDTPPSYRAKRDTIQRANAGYLVSHGLRPVDEHHEPAEGVAPLPRGHTNGLLERQNAERQARAARVGWAPAYAVRLNKASASW
jgi:hypothetical protein